MVIKEGDLVIITAKLPHDWPYFGTFIGRLNAKRVQVLLANGFIFTGLEHEVYLFEEKEITNVDTL